MKITPIPFPAPMVVAILEGRKMQARAVIKGSDCWGQYVVRADKIDGEMWRLSGDVAINKMLFGHPTTFVDVSCPYGTPGDRLWVQETWAKHRSAENRIYGKGDGHWWGSPIYKATFGAMLAPKCEGFTSWKSPVTMPRWASRITLEIAGVRVERLQDIRQADAMAEGGPASHPSIDIVSREFGYADFSRSWFAQSWDQKYGNCPTRCWGANPWVWVVEFKNVPV